MLLDGATGVLVDGVWRDNGPAETVRDKFTQQPAAQVRVATPDDTADAVAAAAVAAAHPLPPARRHEILLAASALLRAHEVEIVASYVAETGFTLSDARTELGRAVQTLRLSAEEALRIAGEEVPVAATAGSENRLAFTIRVPCGVVAAIAPFNAPLNTVAHKVGPALAAGNGVVLKPAAQTPLSSMALASALLEAGLPPGYLNVVHGPGSTVGSALVTDPRVRFITFTGSTAVGRTIKQQSGIVKTHLELGANSASIVAADADLELVARLVAVAGYRKAGQVCTSVQRVLVDVRVAGDLAGLLAARVNGLSAGDPRDPAVSVGPLIAPAEAERAAAWVCEVISGGGRVLAGGSRDGALLSPVLVADPPAESLIMRTEIFAPVVALVPVSGVPEAVAMVNDGPYGLQAGVFTSSIDTAFDAARRLRVGGVMINDTSSYHADAMPYGGVKDSGYGLEGPKYAVQDMTDPRIIVLNLGAS
ncbi:MAG: aldehyde dehydrogenase family protein [Streptosporangiaceae bacterium]|nr:aldehyde dehydrogenase family protein [Streptosporangiaceae bacterium]